jgi:hypothetical protein
MLNNLFDQMARLFAASMAARITQSIAPLVSEAVAYLQDLQVHCPEAFDDAGNLRTEWQEIVRTKLAAMQNPPPVPVLHFELMTRKYRVNVN